MIGLIARRLFYAALVIVGLIFVVSQLIIIVPGDAVDIISSELGMSNEEREALRHKLGLNRSSLEQFWIYFTNALQGDFGESLRFRTSNLDLVLARLPATFELTVLAMILAVALAIPIGMITAIKRDTVIDYGGTVIAVLGVSIPSFILGILLIVFFAVGTGWLPAAGRGEFLPIAIWRAVVEGDFDVFWDSCKYLVLPVVSLALSILAWNARLIRSAMLDVMQQDYIRFARAKGVPDWRLYLRHALKNALIPALTITGCSSATLSVGRSSSRTSSPGRGWGAC